MKNNRTNLETEGLKTIDIELRYYDKLKLTQTSRGFLILFVLLFYLPMTVTIGFASLLWWKTLISFIVIPSIVYFIHKRAVWAYVVLPIFLYADAIFLIMELMYIKVIFIPIIFTPFFYQAYVVEREHRRKLINKNYESQYTMVSETDIDQNGSSNKSTRSIKSSFLRFFVLASIVVYVFYNIPEKDVSLFETLREMYIDIFNLLKDSPEYIFLSFLPLLIPVLWVWYRKAKKWSVVQGLLIGILIGGLSIYYMTAKALHTPIYLLK